MFKITVISSPGAAKFPYDPMWATDLKILTQYDENLVKPAILFAEQIDLRSDRLDMVAMVTSRAMSLRFMPMRTFYAYVGLSARNDPKEIELLGLSPDILARPEDVEQFFDGSPMSMPAIRAFWKSHESRLQEAVAAIGEIHRQRHVDLSSRPLNQLVESGLLTTTGWAVGDDDPWALAWTDEAEFFGRIIDDLIGSMSSWGSAVLIEPGTRTFLPGPWPRRHAELAPSSPESLAIGLLARLPALKELPIEDLVEIRSDLKDYLVPFRAEVIAMSEELAAEDHPPKGSDATSAIDHLWHRRVRPIMAEMDAKVKRDGYPRQLLNAFSEDAGSVVSAGASVLLAAGSIYAGVGSLIPAAAAASVPFVRALNASLKARDSIREQRLYFLYQVEQQAVRRAR